MLRGEEHCWAVRDPVAPERFELLTVPDVRQRPVHHVANLALMRDLDQAARQGPSVRLDQGVELRDPAGALDRRPRRASTRRGRSSRRGCPREKNVLST